MSAAQRVLFARGGAAGQLAAEIARSGYERILVVASRRDDARVAELTSGLPVVARVDEVVLHVPWEHVVPARRLALASEADVLVCVGGGSATGLAKAVALETRLPIIAVPTTFAASEATDVWGITDGGHKRTGRSDLVLPQSVVYDPELVVTLPRPVLVASGLNALAHAVDSIWGPKADRATRELSIRSGRTIVETLPVAGAADDDLDAIGRLQLAVHMSGSAFAAAGTGLHHVICHVLGGLWRLDHARLHASLLPHVIAFNEPALDADLRAALVHIYDSPDAPAAAADLVVALDAPQSLRAVGVPFDGIAEAADAVAGHWPAGNPRAFEPDALAHLLDNAWNGRIER